MGINQSHFYENVVIITGASSGIGYEMALQLAEQGAWLALGARNADKLEACARQCHERGGKALAIPIDIANPNQCQSLVESTLVQYGRIDTLINNAGYSVNARFEEIQDMSLLEGVMRVNFWGSVYCTHYALPALKEARGRLACISSGAGKFAAPNSSIYSASKHALGGFFESLRLELAESGVSVTMVYPGWVATGITSRALGADGKPNGKIRKHEVGAMPVDKCVRLIIPAIAKRKRETALTMEIKLGPWVNLLLPRVVDAVLSKEFD
jgi:short-subunit dehydrogenase